jgi:asparagine synthetase B (glutamine-hydrolysing)
MCGLIGGFISSSFGFSSKEVTALYELLYMDSLRGEDSTGLCLVSNTGEVVVRKQATWAPSFLSNKSVFNSLSEDALKHGKIVFGHNRKATVGEISSENAHPFIVDKSFVLMHNGSLPTHKHLADTKVDSEAIAQYLAKVWVDGDSPEEKSKKLAFIGGAWALCWYDLKSEKLNIIRNYQRPLFIGSSGQIVLFCSDEHMLRCVIERNFTASAFKIESLPAHTLVTFDGKTTTKVELPFFQGHQPKEKIIYPTVGGTYSTTKETVPKTASMSKNEFKRFLKVIVGKKITFSLDDYTSAGKDKIFWSGTKPDWVFDHELVGAVPQEFDLNSILDNFCLATGEVVAGFYSKG